MSGTLTRLFPAPSRECARRGLYLEQGLHLAGRPEKPFVYANFLTSLDGRIAVTDPDTGHTATPVKLTSEIDFRLFMELHAQADCLITHGGYLRSLAAGKLGNILQVGSRPENRDLAQWRSDNGLPAQPAVVIASASLDFPMPDSLKRHRQQVYIATGANADPARIAFWQNQGYPVLLTGTDRRVQGKALITALGDRGFQSIYLIAGPEMLDTMIREHQLSGLYQTISHQLIGGEDFHTLLPGPILDKTNHLKLSSLYYHAHQNSAAGQFFCHFDLSD